MEYILIDKRMRNVEKNMLKYLGYKLVPIETSNNVYAEISSHVDIFTTKIGDTLIVEKSKYEATSKQLIQLESAYTIDYTKLKPIIRYKDKKIEIIKSVPVYVGKDCEKELQSVKNIIDSF